MPVDHFATLGLPQRAALDEEAVQQAYLTQSKNAHPDQQGGDTQASTAVNEARAVIISPEKRLKHLLELHGRSDWKAVVLDDAFMTVFSRLGTLLPRAQALAEKAARSQSALGKALLASEEMQLREALEDITRDITSLRQPLLAQLPDFDQRMAEAAPDVWDAIHATQARLSYTTKWQAQIREALLQLTTLLQ